MRELPGEANELFELAARGARVDRAGRQLDSLLQVARPGSGDQRGGGVHQHDLAARSRVATEDGPDDLGVLLAIAPEEIADRGARQAEVLGPDGGRPDDALADLEKACAESEEYREEAKSQPEFAPLLEDPRFLRIVEGAKESDDPYAEWMRSKT